MQLERIRERIAAYRGALPRAGTRFAWTVQAHFQGAWDLEAPDMKDMFGRSLWSGESRRLWSRSQFQPKAVMEHFLDMEPEQVRLMFRDLYREERDLAGRVDRFRFMADQLLDQYREEGRRPLLAGHDQDSEAIGLYLAMRYPDRYAPYDHGAFVAALRHFRVKDLPVQPDLVRWSKVARTLDGLLRKDQSLMEVYAAFLAGDACVEPTLLLAWDFVRFVGWEGSERWRSL